MEDAGIRDDYKLIGPFQSLYKYMDRLSILEYLYDKIDGTEYVNMVDINSSHAYTKSNVNEGYENTIYEPYASYSMAEENFTYYNEILTNIGQSDKEIMLHGNSDFDDIIPARSFSIYVSNDTGFVGDDSEIPLD